MAAPRRGLAVVVLAGLALWALWLLLPAASPPVYDGICLADPYRQLGATPGPSSASMTYPAGPFPATEVATNESPPQAALVMMSDTFAASSSITVSIAPVAAPAAHPAKGSIDGNAYRFSATDAAGTALTGQSPITVELRGTRSNPARTLERFDGTRWTSLQTFAAGCGDVFAADTTRLGVLALVITGTAPGPTPGAGAPVGLIAGVLVVVLVAAVLLLIRLNRTRPG
jgi:hypothetical protein